jgi:hypothetical protein
VTPSTNGLTLGRPLLETSRAPTNALGAPGTSRGVPRRVGRVSEVTFEGSPRKEKCSLTPPMKGKCALDPFSSCFGD